ncbi:MAG: hypothetical protein QXQ57_04770 [Sulfolobales archaeon]
MGKEYSIERYLVFSSKKVGKKIKRLVDVVRIYPYRPVERGKPLFEARVGRDYVVAFLNALSAPYKIYNNVIIVEGEDPDYYVRRLVIYTGVKQFLEAVPRELMDIAVNASEIEAVFWYSKFVEAYENIGYWGVYRVAKALRTIYRL